MKLMLILGLLGVSTIVLAVESNEGGFEAHKKDVLGRMDTRIAALQSLKTCISASGQKADIKACRSKMNDTMKGMRASRKANRSAKVDKKIEKLQAKKAKMEAKKAK